VRLEHLLSGDEHLLSSIIEEGSIGFKPMLPTLRIQIRNEFIDILRSKREIEIDRASELRAHGGYLGSQRR
jgi:hypothetical protein